MSNVRSRWNVGLALLIAAPLLSTEAYAFECISCAKEWTQLGVSATQQQSLAQLINHSKELATHTTTLAEQLKTQAKLEVQNKQLDDQKLNTEAYASLTWTNSQQDLKNVMEVARQGEALSFASVNLGEAFNRKFPGYQKSKEQAEDHKKWSKTLRDTIRQALEGAKLQADQFATEEQVLQKLREASTTAKGRMQALQVGNQIAMEVAGQMQKLREMMMLQQQSQTAYLAIGQQEKDFARAAQAKFIPDDSAASGKQYSSYLPGDHLSPTLVTTRPTAKPPIKFNVDFKTGAFNLSGAGPYPLDIDPKKGVVNVGKIMNLDALKGKIGVMDMVNVDALGQKVGVMKMMDLDVKGGKLGGSFP